MHVPTVCHLVISLAHGGLERLVVDWTNARNRRHPGSTRVCCLDEGGDLAAALAGDVLSVLRADRSRFPWDTAAVRALRQMLRDRSGQGVDILHSHNIAAQQYAALSAKRMPGRHFHTEHGSNAFTEGVFNRLRLRRLAKATGTLVCVSDDTASRIAPHWGLGVDGFQVIPNGVSPHPPFGAENGAAVRREFGIGADRTVIGSVGRLSMVKGYDRFLPVLAELIGRGNPLVFLLVGDGPERDSLEGLIRELGIADEVILAGYQENGRRFYDAFDLFVLPSRSEGLSIALLEAMAARCPVVVTDAGENRIVLDEGRAGRILPNDENAWADTLEDILRGQGQAVSSGLVTNAKQRVDDHYASAQTMQAYEDAYRQLMASPS